MKVRDYLAGLDDDYLDLETNGIVLVAMTTGAPTVCSTVPPEIASQVLSLIVNDGDWSNTIERKTN